MREPLSKFPTRPTGPDETRRILAECEAMLARRNLSPEMREGLKQRVAQLRMDARADASHRARAAVQDADEPAAPARRPRR